MTEDVDAKMLASDVRVLCGFAKTAKEIGMTEVADELQAAADRIDREECGDVTDALFNLLTKREQQVVKLRALLKEAALDLHSWGTYADEYYQRKWDLDGNVLKYLNAASGVAGSDERLHQ